MCCGVTKSKSASTVEAACTVKPKGLLSINRVQAGGTCAIMSKKKQWTAAVWLHQTTEIYNIDRKIVPDVRIGELTPTCPIRNKQSRHNSRPVNKPTGLG